MNKNLTKLALIAALGTVVVPSLYSGLIDLTFKIGVTTCTGSGSTCNVTINAIGDVVELDVSKVPVKDLGSIGKDTLINVALPSEGMRKVYSYTPSAGELAGKKIFLTFDNQLQRAGTRLAGKSVIKLYRQLQGDMSNQWTDVGEIFTQQAKSDMPKEFPFTFKKNGNVETQNPDNVLPDGTLGTVTFVLGQKNVNAAL